MKKGIFLWSVCVLYGCGEELSVPKFVDLTDLQPVVRLEPIPGDGKIVLKFEAANNEEDFSGFNIFRLKEGKTFQEVKRAFNLSQVDNKDPHIYTSINIDDSNRTLLGQYFHQEAGEDCAVDSKGAETSTKLCPYARCYAASGKCEVMAKPEKKDPSNGSLYFVDEDLTNGTEYTYFVVPTIKEGKRIASMTSQVVKIRPRKTYTLANIPKDLKTFGIEIKASAGNSISLQEMTNPQVAGKTEYCLVTPKVAGSTVHFYFDTINGKTGPTSAGGARWATLGSPQDENGNPLQKEWNSVDFILGTNSLVHPLGEALSTIENSQDTMKKIGKSGYADCGKTGALRPYTRYAIALPDGKYAVLYTGEGQGEDFDANKFKLVIGETAEDLRL